MIADASNKEIDRLNARAQHLRAERGELGHREVPLGHIHYGLREGDIVAFTSQHRPAGQPRVENGTRGQVTRVDEHGRLTVELDGSGRSVRLAREDIDSLRLGYALAERLQLGLGDRRLNQRKDLVLLEPDMIRESPTEVVEQLERRRARKQGCVAADQHVVEAHADDRGVVGFAVSGIGWKEKLLLDAEVQLLLGVPVVEEHSRCLCGCLSSRAA